MSVQVVRRLALLATLLFVFEGCAAGPRFGATSSPVVPPDQALVYLYRPGKIMGFASEFKIFANNQHVTSLPIASYYHFYAQPGHVAFAKKMQAHVLNFTVAHLDPSTTLLNLNVEAGRTYYLRFRIGFGSPTLEVVSEHTALKEMANLKLSDGA